MFALLLPSWEIVAGLSVISFVTSLVIPSSLLQIVNSFFQTCSNNLRTQLVSSLRWDLLKLVSKFVTTCSNTYTARNATQVVNFTSLMQVCHQVTSSLFAPSSWMRLMLADLLQVVETTSIKLVDKKSWQSTCCIKPVDNLSLTCHRQARVSVTTAT